MIIKAKPQSKKEKLRLFLVKKGRAGATGKELIKNVGSDYGTYIHNLRKAGSVIHTFELITPGVGMTARYVLQRTA